jgi:hypothetical protein
MLCAAASGERLDLGKGPFDLVAMKAWGPRRTVRAAVLRHLLVDEEWPVHAKGVQLRGVRISGRLDLEAAALRCPLRLEDCYLANPRPVILDYATVLLLTLTGCHLAGLSGDTVIVAKDLGIKGSTLTGPLRLPDADITGQLTCRASKLTGTDNDGNALAAWRVRVGGDVFLDGGFTAAGAVQLSGAGITGQLTCRGAQLTSANSQGNALIADRIKVGGHALLDGGFTAAGAVRLSGAGITGQLSCSGAQLTSANSNGNALAADGMRVGGHVFLDERFTAAGAVLLSSAAITGQLNCRGAQLTGADSDGDALVADGVRVGRQVLLDGGFTAAGAVRLSGADITGQLRCSGAQLTGANSQGNALFANGMKVGDTVLLDDGFTAAGTVSIRSARIDGSLWLMPAELAQGKDIMAMDATGAQIAHELRWAPSKQVNGLICLEDSTVGQLEDDWTYTRGPANGYWPPADQGLLRLDGFTYGRISGQHPATLQQRLKWIGSQPGHARGTRLAGFASQPYEQLATVYRQAGKDSEARKVAIARRRDLRRYGDLTRSRRAANWLLYATIRYGYQTWRAVAGLAFVFAVVLAISWFAQYQAGLIVPAQDTTKLHPAPLATRCASNYPCFSPVGYTIDTVIPLINIHQADYWRPNASAAYGWVLYVSWAGTGLGWALATLIVAGYTGLVRSADAP